MVPKRLARSRAPSRPSRVQNRATPGDGHTWMRPSALSWWRRMSRSIAASASAVGSRPPGSRRTPGSLASMASMTGTKSSGVWS